ncbi:unnamed protein product [Candida verbasci]|uniref:ATP-dependent RNA helicase n=1 Tax=Candida verbasci TaxID=1227364 RepID=A0A9W4TUU9_9ASCO|nr:unnamed protein product [Candida verbasci]
MFSTRYDPANDMIENESMNFKKRKIEHVKEKKGQIDHEHDFDIKVAAKSEPESDVEMQDNNHESRLQETSYAQKHSSIFEKFKLSTESSRDIDDKFIKDEEEVNYEDLKPLPQPVLPEDERLKSNKSHLKNLDWLTQPQYFSTSDVVPFENFSLSPFIMKNLKKLEFHNAFAVQVAVLEMIIPEITANKLRPDTFGDILVNASTGSGKTLAYSIPILEALHDRVVPKVRAIILVPTKPLINQVRTTLLQLSQGTNLNIVNLRNDISIKEESNKLLNSVPDIIVSTPGRLVDHITQNSIDLSMLRFLVIDEADKLLNQTFQNWSSILIDMINQNINISKVWKLSVQKLIFSATLTTDAGKLSSLNFIKPRLIIVNDSQQLVNEMFQVPSTLKEFKMVFGVAKNSIKPLILTKFLISQSKLSNILIFTSSNESSIRLAKILQILFNELNLNINVQYLNSTNNKAVIRNKILKDFNNQCINILVATDLIARGIDITSITDVINYDLPNSSREYIHRVGRTARANQPGAAYNLIFGKGEQQWFNSFSKDIGRNNKVVEDIQLNLKELITDNDEEVYQNSLNRLQDLIKD